MSRPTAWSSPTRAVGWGAPVTSVDEVVSTSSAVSSGNAKTQESLGNPLLIAPCP